MPKAVRALRMGVQMADVDHPAKVVLVTSSIPQEGKIDAVALSLAFSALKAGLRTALIDGDLRHPSITPLLRLGQQAGAGRLLTGAVAAWSGD